MRCGGRDCTEESVRSDPVFVELSSSSLSIKTESMQEDLLGLTKRDLSFLCLVGGGS